VVEIEYRIHDRHCSTPIESIADAKSAIRWVRRNAERLGIDRERVIAAGFSAGAHLAASAAMLPGFEDAAEERSVPASPDALALFGACVDPTADPWYARIVRGRAEPADGSPAHNVRAGLAPMILMHGTADRVCPHAAVDQFVKRMLAEDNLCQLESFPGRSHFFVMESRDDRASAVERLFEFLRFLGFVD
jgi:acetyl esterase/lipase